MKKFLIAIFAFSILSSQSVKSEIYVGIDYLKNKFDSGITNISSTLDEEDNGFSLYTGFPLNDNLDFEVSYNDFGESSLSGVSGNQFKFEGTTYEFNTTATLAASATSIGFAAKPKLDLGEGITLFGKLGVHNWDSEFEITSTTATASEDDEGSDVYYGAGIEIDLVNIKGRFGYSLYDLDGEDVDSMNAGLIIKF